MGYKKKVLLWTKDIDHMILDDDPASLIGGIHVQMYMWGKIFSSNNWNVYSFTKCSKNAGKEYEGFAFRYFPEKKLINPIISLLWGLYYILLFRPRIIIVRGAIRDLFFIKILTSFQGTKVIQMFASDSDLEPGKEIIKRGLDRCVYRLGVRITKMFVVQNAHQELLLKDNYRKQNYILVPQVWIQSADYINNYERQIILWVSNFKKLKRPEWFLELARNYPEKEFVMVGFPSDYGLYESCRLEAARISNLHFLGGQSFQSVNELFSRALLFVCTSEIEGFPNTFIQSWINGCPVLTTFDPGCIIKEKNLGIFCNNKNELFIGFEKLLYKGYRNELINEIQLYCKNNLDPQIHYERLMKKFDLL